ncbi:hypothetical protein ACFWIW_10880 [Amycolatopsis sp. NPDC058340]|uniref:hypothetical protein n=1 Tax=Amycolatopsis sp. NPDC058340 TaxID=3346453 RepID=UPI0036515844
MADRKRANYLSPPDLYRLDWACRPIVDAFDRPVYLVGSVYARADYRDVDLRLILDDTVYARMVLSDAWLLLTNIAYSDLIAKAANLPVPVDFQIQSMTEANVPEHGHREPIGIRWDIKTREEGPR